MGSPWKTLSVVSAITAVGVWAAAILYHGSAPTPVVRVAATTAPQPPHKEGTYHGCPVFRPGDWLTTNLVTGNSTYVPTTIDVKSQRIIKNLIGAFGDINLAGNVPTDEEGVNIVNSGNLLATPVIEDLIYGFANNVHNDNPPPHKIEINRGVFMQEGTRYCVQRGQDCHVIVLDTDKCVDYETYRSGGVSWNGSRYTAEGGGVENLRHPYQREHITVTAANLPMLGTTDFGEEVQYQRASCRPNCSIPHVLALFLPLPKLATFGYVAPAYGTEGNCTKGTRYCDAYTLPYGARLRLKASFRCPDPATYPQANLLCNQAKQYGAIFNDTVSRNGAGGVRLGLSADTTDPWRSSDFNNFLSSVHLSDFDVITLGRVDP